MYFFIALFSFEIIMVYIICLNKRMSDDVKYAIWAGLLGILYFATMFYIEYKVNHL